MCSDPPIASYLTDISVHSAQSCPPLPRDYIFLIFYIYIIYIKYIYKVIYICIYRLYIPIGHVILFTILNP